MKKRTWLRLGIVGLVGLATFIAYLWLTTPSHRIDRASFEQITVGMTQAEVEAILRVPPGKYCAKTAMMEAKRMDGSTFGLPMDELWPKIEEFDAQTDDNFRRATWAGDRGIIAISFDHENRVVAKDFAGMYSEGFAARLRNWLATIF